MTMMKHKTVHERRARRQRYADAIDPLRRRYNCTAKQVAELVFADLNQMQRQLKDTRKKLGDALQKASDLETLNDVAVAERDEFQSEWTNTVSEFAGATADHLKLLRMFLEVKEENAALKIRVERQDRELELLRPKQ